MKVQAAFEPKNISQRRLSGSQVAIDLAEWFSAVAIEVNACPWLKQPAVSEDQSY